MKPSLAIALLTVTAALGGCLNEADPIVEETDGVLGLGTFRWECTSSADTTCGTGNFPNLVALGGRFDLTFMGSPDLPDEVRHGGIEPASRDRITQTPNYTALVEGSVSMAAVSSQGHLIDYVSLTVRPVGELSLSLAQEDDHEDVSCGFIYCQEIPAPGPMEGGDVAMFVGDAPRVQTMPYSASGLRLAGTLDYQWESLTPDLLTVSNVQGREAQLRAMAEGTAQLRITAGGHEQLIDVYIASPPPPDPDTPEEPPRRNPPEDDTGTGGEDESGSDSGSGNESGTGGSDESGTDGDESGSTGGMG